MNHQIARKILRVHALLDELRHLRVVIVNALAARRDLQPAEEQVERKRVTRIFRIIRRIERTLLTRIMRDKHKLAAVFLRKQAADELLFLRLKVKRVANRAAVFLADHALRIVEPNGGNARYIRHRHMQRGQLRRVIRFQHRHDVLQHLRFHLHDVLKSVDEAHFKIHRRVFVQMALGVVLLRAEHRADFKHALVNRHHRLLVKLRALGQIRAAAEIFHAEQVRAALRVLRDDLRGMDLRESLFLQRLAETADNAFLNLKHRALAEVAQRHKAQRQIRIQRQVHLVFADRHRHGFRRAGEHLNALRMQLRAARRTLVAHHFAADLHRVAVANVFIRAQHALQHALRHAQQRKAHIAQIAQRVHKAMHRRPFACLHRQHFQKRAVLSFGFACHRLHIVQPSFRPRRGILMAVRRAFPKEKPSRTDSFCSGRDQS